jgi:glucose/arabinose dehydrogenase
MKRKLTRRITGWFMLRCIAALALSSCSNSTVPGNGMKDNNHGGMQLAVEVIASGLKSPVHLSAPKHDRRLFVVEQDGVIRIIADGLLLKTPFLDIRNRVGSGGERGLLSIAFHPDYTDNGLFYVNYTDKNADTRVERYTVTVNPNLAEPNSAKLILTVEQPFGNHNGGLIVFGPDGMLYIGMGDGGSGGDPQRNGQNRNTLLGALLRINVDNGDPYAVPTDNPFVSDPGARGEIWAYGLRNPWRFAFDRQAGTLYIADVGQNRWEEVNAVSAAIGGLNYGWNIMEGAHCYPTDPCDNTGLIRPAIEYGHADGCSVIGGHVYRGASIPAIRGHYFYSDFCEGFLRSFRFADGVATDERQWDVGDLGKVMSFGEDDQSEIYILSKNGRVYRLTPAAS